MAEKTYSDSAMLALIPSAEDAERLAIDGYQPADDLHVTLVFLGDADGIDEATVGAIDAGAQRLASSTAPMKLQTWATSHFNPKGDSPCAVYLVGSGDSDADNGVLDSLDDAALEMASNEYPNLPDQHTPWIPHMTIGYDLDPDELGEVGQPIVFDRLRFSIGDEDRNYPLVGGAPMAASLGAEVGFRLGRVEALLAARGLGAVKRVFNELLHPRGSDGRFIEKNGWVSGSVDVDGKDRQIPRGRVRGFIDNPTDSNDPIIEIELGDGTVVRGLSSKVKKTVGPKARLDAPDAPDAPGRQSNDAPDIDVPEVDTPAPPRVELSDEAVALRERLNASVVNLNDEDPEIRAAQLDDILADLFQSELDTDAIYDKLGPAEDMWAPERMELHERMWESFIAGVREKGVPQDRDALVMGGLPGAGKSSALKPGGVAASFGINAWDPAEEDIPEATHVSVNPDSIKVMLIHEGALPEGLSPKIKPMESVTLIHEESSFLSKLFLKRLSDEGYNVVLDNTMDSPAGMAKRMVPLASEGYEFRGIFADIPVEESKASARARYARAFRSEMGGRLVPSAVQHGKKSTRGRFSPNRDTFDELAGIDANNNVSGNGWFKDFVVVDNTGVSEGSPLKIITVEGVGDGSPARIFREERLNAPVPEAESGGAPDGPPFSSEGLQDFLTETFGEDYNPTITRKGTHPRTGKTVNVGEQKRLAIPEEGEGPLEFIVNDFGDPPKPFPDKDIRREPVPFVYRGISLEEWEQAQERGYFQSDQRGTIEEWEGTNAGIDARSAASYLPRDGKGVIVKIAVDPEDEWFASSVDSYARTRKPIPLDRVETVSPVLTKDGTSLLQPGVVVTAPVQ